MGIVAAHGVYTESMEELGFLPDQTHLLSTEINTSKFGENLLCFLNILNKTP